MYSTELRRIARQHLRRKEHRFVESMVRSSTKLNVEYQKDFSGLIAAWSNGDDEALNELIPLVYPELRRIARQHLRRKATVLWSLW